MKQTGTGNGALKLGDTSPYAMKSGKKYARIYIASLLLIAVGTALFILDGIVAFFENPLKIIRLPAGICFLLGLAAFFFSRRKLYALYGKRLD
jgi:hypothetical protein